MQKIQKYSIRQAAVVVVGLKPVEPAYTTGLSFTPSLPLFHAPSLVCRNENEVIQNANFWQCIFFVFACCNFRIVDHE